jgi:hypothetical protein
VNVLVAVLAISAVILGLVTAVLGLINQRRIEKAGALAARTADKVQSISVNVDGRLSGLIERQAQLLGTLHESGIPIPPRPPDPPHPEGTPP